MVADISATPEWEALQQHALELETMHLRSLFEADPSRAERFVVPVGDWVLDWSRHLVTERTVELLLALAERADVAGRIAAMLAGEPVNVTENRPALHTALRASTGQWEQAIDADTDRAISVGDVDRSTGGVVGVEGAVEADWAGGGEVEGGVGVDVDRSGGVGQAGSVDVVDHVGGVGVDDGGVVGVDRSDGVGRAGGVGEVGRAGGVGVDPAGRVEGDRVGVGVGRAGGLGVDVGRAVDAELTKMADFARSVRSGERLGATGRPITAIVHIGIGGSYLGPVMAYEALAAFRHPRIRCRFVANADGADLSAALNGLDPAETLFVLVSKSFTTAETSTNGRSARAWITATLGAEAVERHFVAVSAAGEAVADFGISAENTFALWDWVGGRYSLASAVGLSLMVAIGEDGFRQMLAGMRTVDEHLATQPLHTNGPVLMGLLAVWCRNFLGLPARAVLPYSHRLRLLPDYLQQLEMESNGKRVRLDGQPVTHHTSPIIFGQPGTCGQHSFHQFLHQGTTVVPVDFILFANADPDTAVLENAQTHQHLLVASCLAQAAALAFGTQSDTAPTSGDDSHPEPARESCLDSPSSRHDSHLEPGRGSHPEPARESRLDSSSSGHDSHLGPGHDPHLELLGNRPSTLLTAAQLTPTVLGQLIALYEHQVVVQGAIWHINSFDQYGVERGKKLTNAILRDMRTSSEIPVEAEASPTNHDPATQAALDRLRVLRQG